MGEKLSLTPDRRSNLVNVRNASSVSALRPISGQMEDLYRTAIIDLLIYGDVDKEDVWRRVNTQNPSLSHDRREFDNAWAHVRSVNGT
jgi:hypothetical protein